MKLLMFDANDFWYKTFEKTVDYVETHDTEAFVQEALVIFINVEKNDETRRDRIAKKAVENVSWLARKTGRKRVVLHSFAHLSDSKSSIAFAEGVFRLMVDRLEAKGLETYVTPFGYFLEFKIHVRGESLAKVWKSL
ncbi:MAG: threonyl-tRNA synthetase editing domain-containing protein [Halobacteriota archaeon]